MYFFSHAKYDCQSRSYRFETSWEPGPPYLPESASGISFPQSRVVRVDLHSEEDWVLLSTRGVDARRQDLQHVHFYHHQLVSVVCGAEVGHTKTIDLDSRSSDERSHEFGQGSV